MRAANPASLTTTPPADPSGLADPPELAIRLFLMVNTFETGGSERQFIVMARNFTPPQFQTHLGCISRRGPLAHNFPDAVVLGVDQSPRQNRSSTVMLSAWMHRHFNPITSETRNPVQTLTNSIDA